MEDKRVYSLPVAVSLPLQYRLYSKCDRDRNSKRSASQPPVKWKKLFVRLTVWAATEILLNCVGLDDLADYSEFIFERNSVVISQLN